MAGHGQNQAVTPRWIKQYPYLNVGKEIAGVGESATVKGKTVEILEIWKGRTGVYVLAQEQNPKNTRFIKASSLKASGHYRCLPVLGFKQVPPCVYCSVCKKTLKPLKA